MNDFMKKLILILLTFVLAMSFMTGCSAAEQSTETTEKICAYNANRKLRYDGERRGKEH